MIYVKPGRQIFTGFGKEFVDMSMKKKVPFVFNPEHFIYNWNTLFFVTKELLLLDVPPLHPHHCHHLHSVHGATHTHVSYTQT